jgi:uridine kinase
LTTNSSNQLKPKLLLVAGGSGSGKTYFVNKLIEALTDERGVLISQDSYYKNLDHLTLEERRRVNFDHPDSIDFKLLEKHIKLLKTGKSVEIPEYDFTTHTRISDSMIVHPKEVIILEGILILGQEALLELADLKIFVDTSDDIRILRRTLRDVRERGRTLDSVISQYFSTVRPMHKRFVEPSKINSDLLINGEDSIDEYISQVIDKII